MNFKDWFSKSNHTMNSLSEEVGLSHNTISNILKGKAPVVKTVQILVKETKNFHAPITYDMFPKVHLRGTSKTISGSGLFKRLMEKELKKRKAAPR
jgi:hypothetical protein